MIEQYCESHRCAKTYLTNWITKFKLTAKLKEQQRLNL